MHIFYLPDAAHGPVLLPEEESKHAVRVLRLNSGDNVLVTNGKGSFFHATLLDAHPKRAVLQLGAPQAGNDHWGFHLHLAVAPTKNTDRIEWLVEKATEIGIDEISFFHSFHSERRTVNIDRLQKIAVAAMKQSLKSRLPKINEIASFAELMKMAHPTHRYIAWIDPSVELHLAQACTPQADSLILIGPEGDFSHEEVMEARKAGIQAVSLGKARLRTETAALFAVQTVQLINQLKK